MTIIDAIYISYNVHASTSIRLFKEGAIDGLTGECKVCNMPPGFFHHFVNSAILSKVYHLVKFAIHFVPFNKFNRIDSKGELVDMLTMGTGGLTFYAMTLLKHGDIRLEQCICPMEK